MEGKFLWTVNEVLGKIMTQVIPTYSISIFKFTEDFCDEVQTFINRF